MCSIMSATPYWAITPLYQHKCLPPLARTLRGLYSFTPSEALAGSRLMMSGYPTLLSEQTTDETGDLASITLEGDLYRFPTGMFKAGELSWIFQEVCVPPGQNPHAYENEFVSIQPGDVVLDAGPVSVSSLGVHWPGAPIVCMQSSRIPGLPRECGRPSAVNVLPVQSSFQPLL